MEDLGLEELKNQFDRELLRKDSLESKASYIVAITAIILPLLLSILLEIIKKESISSSGINSVLLIILIFNIFLIIITLLNTIKILDITSVYYPVPSSDPNELEKFYFKNNDLNNNLKDYYLGCISLLNLKNNSKASSLSVCFKLISISSILILIMFVLVLI